MNSFCDLLLKAIRFPLKSAISLIFLRLELNFSLVLKAEVHVLEQALLLFGNYMVI